MPTARWPATKRGERLRRSHPAERKRPRGRRRHLQPLHGAQADSLITPPVTENVLEGITRDSIIELAHRELGLQVVERPIDRSELYVCDELFLTGTAVGVAPVVRVDHRPVEDGAIGAMTRDIQPVVFRGDARRICGRTGSGWFRFTATHRQIESGAGNGQLSAGRDQRRSEPACQRRRPSQWTWAAQRRKETHDANNRSCRATPTTLPWRISTPRPTPGAQPGYPRA